MKKIINYTSPASTVKIPKNLTNQIQISYRLKIKRLEFFEFRGSKSPLKMNNSRDINVRYFTLLHRKFKVNSKLAPRYLGRALKAVINCPLFFQRMNQ